MSRFLRFGQLATLFVASLALQACAGPDDLSDVASDDREARAVDLEVTLSLDQAAYAAHEPVLATVTVKNRGKNPAKILAWNLPNADLEENLFRVVREGGKPSAFVGAHYKRPNAVDTDYVHLAAGASLVRTVDLAKYYDLSAGGDYVVKVTVAGRDSNNQAAWIEGRAVAQPDPVLIDAGTESLAFSGRCSETQKEDITIAVDDAAWYSEGARIYLNGSPSGTSRYTEWFGLFSLSRWNTVRDHFDAIDFAFDTKPITVDCKCKKNYYAYVYPNQPYTIYVCRAFWSAPATGKDSKAGTLIHEMSHFNAVASTDDLAYGQTACRTLADNDPASAIWNADSHEYFAENDPFLP